MGYKFNADLALDHIATFARMAVYICKKPVGLEKECRSGGAVCLLRDEDEFVVASFGPLLYCNNASSYKSEDEAWDMFDQDRRGLIADLKSYNSGEIPDSYRHFLNVVEQTRHLMSRAKNV
jgi:hypothetical protein